MKLWIHGWIIFKCENVLLASKLIGEYNKSFWPISYYMLKVDIRKAFNTMCKDFVIKILEIQSFPLIFVTWIHEYITSSRFPFVINGELTGSFEGKKGQCDDRLFCNRKL